jgi:predicted esterase
VISDERPNPKMKGGPGATNRGTARCVGVPAVVLRVPAARVAFACVHRVVLPCVAAMLVANVALADAPRHVKGPCSECLASIPEGDSPAPLLILLHGDGEPAGSMFDAWEPAAAKRGIFVSALACPRSEGCTARSWWKWNGDPAWVKEQVVALAAMRAVDPGRLWIVGWSGGGTYLGWRTQDFERDFAALVIHGGGVRPAVSRCADAEASIYFLGGDRNPLHDLAEQLHAYYADTCPHADLTWTVLPGADHAGELRALGAYRPVLLDWLALRVRRPSASTGDASAEGGTPLTVPVVPEVASTPVAPPASIRPPEPSPSPSCRCASVVSRKGWTTPEIEAAAVLILALGVGLGRRHGGRRSTPSTR